MTIERKYMVDVVRDWVNSTAIKLNTSIYYEHGHPLDVASIIEEKAKGNRNSFRKYPMVMLVQDFEEKHNSFEDWMTLPSLTVLIITSTEASYNAAQRYEETFKPVLYPILEAFIRVINNSEHLSQAAGNYEYTKIDRLYWGKVGIHGNNGTIINDKLDCIELKFTNLLIRKNC